MEKKSPKSATCQKATFHQQSVISSNLSHNNYTTSNNNNNNNSNIKSCPVSPITAHAVDHHGNGFGLNENAKLRLRTGITTTSENTTTTIVAVTKNTSHHPMAQQPIVLQKNSNSNAMGLFTTTTTTTQKNNKDNSNGTIAGQLFDRNAKALSVRNKNEEAIQDLRTRIPEIENIFDIQGRIGNGTFSTVLLGTLKKERQLSDSQKRKFAIKHHIPTSHPERIMKELQCMAKIG